MPSTTTKAPSTVQSGIRITGSTSWASPASAATDDGNASTATVSAASSSTDSLDATGFSISLPLTAIPTQLDFEVKAQGSSGLVTVQDFEVYMGFPGTNETNGTDLAAPTTIGTSQSTISYSLGGTVWTRGQVMDPSFGLSFRAKYKSGLGSNTVSVFYIGGLRVTYSLRPLRIRTAGTGGTRFTYLKRGLI